MVLCDFLQEDVDQDMRLETFVFQDATVEDMMNSAPACSSASNSSADDFGVVK